MDRPKGNTIDKERTDNGIDGHLDRFPGDLVEVTTVKSFKKFRTFFRDEFLAGVFISGVAAVGL